MAEEKASVEERHAGSGLRDVRLAVVKRAKIVVLLPLVAALMAFAVASLLPDRYSATALLQIDPDLKEANSAGDTVSSVPAAFETERLAINGQIEILTSSAFLDRVVQSLHLTLDPEFQSRPLWARIAAPFAKTDPATVAREALANRLTVGRVRTSSLINVRVSTYDAKKAAMIANALTSQYVSEANMGASQLGPSKTGSAVLSESEKVFASLLSQYGPSQSLTGARIVEDAHTPKRPSGPKRTRIAVAAGGTVLILMLVLAVLLERDAQLNPRKIEQMLSCPHMTSLPAVADDDAASMPARRARLIIAEPNCRYADAVRTTAQELLERSDRQEPCVVLVASALANEGAEHFASNIAHYLAMAGQNALLVDGDFEAKTLTRQLAPQNAGGFLDQIASHAPIENVILRDSMTGVHFLPASGPAPIPLAIPAALRSVEFTAAFQHLKARFPIIVVSAPPLLDNADGRVLADLANQIVFLTAWHRTPRSLAKKAVMSLEANQRKIAGAVLADIADDSAGGFMSFAAIFDEVRRAAGLPSLDRAA